MLLLCSDHLNILAYCLLLIKHLLCDIWTCGVHNVFLFCDFNMDIVNEKFEKGEKYWS